jgi:ketosteroid isomerase-like protein
MAMTARETIENFVKVYNEPGSLVYSLYGDPLDWIEMPSGRRGGHVELMAALRGAREMFDDLQMEVLSIVADERNAVLESELLLKSSATGVVVRCRTLWLFAVEHGKIVKEHDYSIVLKD